MRTLRRLVFYLLLAIFLVATPVVLLYAFGYLYRPGHERGFVKSGLISLDTTPGGARIHVGVSRYTARTPAVIRGLLPGRYDLRLSLPGHEPWTGSVVVEAERATLLDQVVLLPRDLTPRIVAEERFASLAPLPGHEWFLLTRGSRAGDLWVFDLDEEAVRPLLPAGHPLLDARVNTRWLVEDSPFVLLDVEHEGDTHYLWTRVDGDDPPADVTRLFPQPPDAVAWDRRARREVFALRSGHVSRLDMEDGAIYPDILSDVLALAVHRDRLYALDSSNRFTRTDRDGQDRERAGLAPAEVRMFWSSRTGYRMRFLGDDLVAFLGENGELFLNQAPHRLAERGVRGLALHPDLDRALVWDPARIGILDFAPESFDVPPVRRPALNWIFESSTPLDHVAWAHHGTHILLASEGEIRLLSLSEGGGPGVRSLARGRPRQPFFHSDRTGCVYFLDLQGRLAAVRFLPRRELLPLGREREPRPRQEAP